MKHSLLFGLLSTSFIVLSGCSSKGDHSITSTNVHNESQTLKEEISRLERENQKLAKKSSYVDELEHEIQTLKNNHSLPSKTHLLSGNSEKGHADLPPNSKPGECYSRVLIPAKYKTSKERVLSKAESYRIETIPAEYKYINQKVLVEEASQKLVVIPATYKTVTEQVIVSEKSSKVVEIPAIYEMVSERILVRPAYTTWKKGTGPIQKVDDTTGEIMCLVEVPAEYKTVTKRVVKQPATTKTIDIPAKYKTINRKVIDKAASTRTIEIPAKYNTVSVKTLIKPASERKIKIPAEYRTVTKRELVEGSYLQWRPILCKTNTTVNVVKRIQEALTTAGYNPGRIDGVLGRDTMNAVTQFQRKNKLPAGQLTIETLKALKVSL